MPRKPTPPKPPVSDKKTKSTYDSLLEQYNFEVEQAKYQAALATFQAKEQSLSEAHKLAAAEWDQAVKRSLAKLAPESLKNYNLVIFPNTTGDLPLPDRDAFIQWVRDGGAFVGMHSASDTFHHYKPYIEMLGGEFQTHGAQAMVDCIIKDPNHPATKHFGPIYNIGGKNEEIYIIKSYNPAAVHELLALDKHPNTREPGHHPIAWCREFGKGKVFYTALGHNEFVWEREDYQKHILGGIKWVLGLEPGDATPQSK
jgi:type 1 glutamine amidotransferase